ncbi:ArnT family glycosyltransferase [Geopsychrobacter electrodiphilus]|uniref:ArnT family glycosyltransferase n=1 Tax=Geopsychrobacter electrodiphilus TaxID=225196 RepID=UPI00037A02AD|nr:glycosyltransferase family 39 protein [Geopsychrobacter electrodiphilus]
MRAVLGVMENLEKGSRAYFFLLLLGLLFFLPGLSTLPPTDRDEARFAQASKQMVETGNYIDIRFQEVPRYKKPIGIYWLQAASVNLMGEPLNVIWPYRIPSLLGALATVLLTCFFGRRFFNRRVGLLAGVLVASCLLLGVESRLAKTDASLLGTIALMQGALGLIYLERQERHRGRWPLVLLFWLACGAGVLIKGPLSPVIALATILSLAAADRNISLLRAIRPLPGLLMVVAMVLPWFIAIQNATHGEFLQKAFFGDFLPKLLAGQESHGAPPGYYLLLFPILFWPGSLLVMHFLPRLWRRRSEDAVRFLFAWLIPAWIIFELVPTKLPHYVMPFFPAIAILTAAGLCQAGRLEPATGWVRRLILALGTLVWCVGAVILMLGLPLLPAWFGQFQPWHILPFAGGVLVLRGAWKLRHNLPPLSVMPLFLGGALLILPLSFADILPRLSIAWPSQEVAEILQHRPPGELISVGFGEPSLPFLNGTKTRMTDAAGAVPLLADPQFRYLLLEGRQKQRLQELAPAELGQMHLVQSFSSYNYSKGKKMRLELYAKP